MFNSFITFIFKQLKLFRVQTCTLYVIQIKRKNIFFHNIHNMAPFSFAIYIFLTFNIFRIQENYIIHFHFLVLQSGLRPSLSHHLCYVF